MGLLIDRNTVVVFDLDDTLYPEIEFVRSGLRHVEDCLSREYHVGLSRDLYDLYCDGERDPIGWACRQAGLGSGVKEQLVERLRMHAPQITLSPGAREALIGLKVRGVPMGLITDGRSVTQRRKIDALGIFHYFSCIVVSEEVGSCKPDEKNFRKVQNTVQGTHYVFVGDNPAKDIAGARALGWTTVGLKRSASNIHRPPVDSPQPDFYIDTLANLLAFVQ